METQKLGKKENTFLSKTVWFLAILVVGLLLAKIFVSNQLATTGGLASAYSTELQELKSENERLGNQVSSLGSVAKISKAAKKLGFVPIRQVQIYRSSSGLALLP
ncbi:MAG: hypothetical protein Q8P13_03950 [bacterium]|nr:hypothetical protein [bacterium]